MTADCDIAVLGAGPAGANAAIQAATGGCSVVLLDEAAQPGGQVWRAKSTSILSAPANSESKAGDALRRAVNQSDITHHGSTRVWQIERVDDVWRLYLLQGNQTEKMTARALILATGAREFVHPIPGWTTPGVHGLAGATALFKDALILPGKNTVVAGAGPLAFFVASEIRRLGGQIAAVITPNSRSEWLRAIPAMSARPDLLARGATWVADLMTSGIPIHWRHAVTAVSGTSQVDAVHFQRVSPDWSPVDKVRTLNADSLCLGHGLIPDTQAAQLAGLELTYRAELGGWVARVAPDGITEVKNLFVCGDGAGILGAAAAVVQGRLAGLAAATGFGAQRSENLYQQLLSQHARAARFGRAATALALPRPGLNRVATPNTIICRCESLTLADIRDEIRTGATSTNAVKAGLRAGMGPCGGRYCQTAVSRLIEHTANLPEGSVAPPTPRPPLRPVPLSAMADDFNYDDLPISKPAPL
ncbi:MAG: FAD-dependent oxidoreductase [Alphaproteobacteria bacterium]|nr:FAD-dependent oxidoreductase [Alphaproteobacteria bacterium]